MKPVTDAEVLEAEAAYQVYKQGGIIDFLAIQRCDICGRKNAAECSDGLYRCLECIGLAFPEGYKPLAV